ncbi:hypothetical protein EWM64_g3641 [Hericium alpestre]|uniref:Uncharacterized protein n=1 Tax=Hericium alpestre TaxID=135208 RepID=A0A4Z0A3B9_9AGAM|nr:hypothetical protein EWM64_g3641 [Hericium alpestre]
MSTRSFIVFQDEPLEPTSRPNASRRSEPPAPPPTVLGSVLQPALSTQEKENLHPVTGARAASSGDLQTKKRKNSVLTTKLHIPPATKKQKDQSAEPKKRKPLGASSKSKANAGSGRKEGKGAAPSRSAGGSGLLRKVAPMPKVDEEVVDAEAQEQEQDKLSHADVDSKCYDLTVSPLADVSKAFDQVPSSPDSELSRAGASKENDDELPTIFKGKSAVASLKKRPSPSKSKSFSTPERKRIYTAFTFSSPSPSSKRFNASRETGLDLFGDIEFKPA